MRANPENAERLLRQGELLGVFPEGVKGVGKRFKERYKLARFGRGGFVRVALRTGAPIVPCAIVGAEEIHPVIGKADWVGRPFGLPYFPITPTFPWLGPLGVVPLPTKWSIDFGEPIDVSGYGPEAAEDPILVNRIAESVRGDAAADGRRAARAPALRLVRLGGRAVSARASLRAAPGRRPGRARERARCGRAGGTPRTRRGSRSAIPCLAKSRRWRAAVRRKKAIAER